MPKRASNDTPPAPGRVTVRSIAERAGVSIGAVSSVLNNHHEKRRIAADTVRRVRAAVAELGYLPNISARRLRGGNDAQNTIVLAIITSFQAPLPVINYFILALREAAAEEANNPRRASFSLVIEMFNAGKLHELPGLLTGAHFNAAIITNTTADDDRFLQDHVLPYPVVLVNRTVQDYPSVIEDPESGAKAATILMQTDRRKLGVLYGQPLTQTTQRRVESFLRAARAAGLPPAGEIVAGGLNEEAAREAMAQFLARGTPLDGLYTVTDGLALGAYQAIKRAGKTIPGDIAVVGIGDYEISPFFDPPLSSVGVSHSELAHAAARMLLRRIGQPKRGSVRLTVPVVERLRESTAPIG
jgi:LacI family transcriptional regulator